jgi:pimeloyl-ACP methyl ester carboxylesterase
VEQLVDHLGLERFAVLGASGGGPHALACASVLGHRLIGVGVVSSLGPREVGPRIAQLPWLARVAAVYARFTPWLLQWGMCALSGWATRNSPEIALTAMQMGVAPLSPRGLGRRTLFPPGGSTDLPPVVRAAVVEPYRQGGREHAWDARLNRRSWGFDLKGLAGVQVHLWHGDRDQLAPVVMGRAVAAAIPGCQTTFFAGEGHDVLNTHSREILAALATPSPEDEQNVPER